MQLLQKIKNWLNTGNHLLWTSIIALIVIGFVSVYFVAGYESSRLGFESNFLFNRYWFYGLIGFLFMLGCSCLSKKTIIRVSWILGVFSILMMILTLVQPWYVLGSARYVRLFGFIFNPFVMMLPAYIVLMSHWLSQERTKQFWTITGITLLTMFIVFAAIKAPYMFMALVYSFAFIFMIFKARKNIPALYKVGVFGFLVIIAMVVLAVIYMPHVQSRLFLNAHPANSQIGMSINALTHSAFIGSTPESLKWLSVLPESSTDFMFTGIVAKFGILMGLLVLALYGLIAKGLTRIIRTTKDKFNELLATGTLALLLIYVVSSVFTAFGILALSSGLPFVGIMTTQLFVWSVLFGFVLAVNSDNM